MATREVDEAEFLTAQGVVQAVNKMLSNPKTRGRLLQLRKETDPNVVIPELDAAAPLNSEMAEIKKAFAEDRAERAADRAERELQATTAALQSTWNRQKDTLRSQGWREEGISAIEKHAQERGISDLEIAAAHWEKINPPAEPAQSSGSSWGFFDQQTEDDKFVPAMLASRGDDEAALNAEISAALRDFRTQSGARR